MTEQTEQGVPMGLLGCDCVKIYSGLGDSFDVPSSVSHELLCDQSQFIFQTVEKMGETMKAHDLFHERKAKLTLHYNLGQNLFCCFHCYTFMIHHGYNCLRELAHAYIGP